MKNYLLVLETYDQTPTTLYFLRKKKENKNKTRKKKKRVFVKQEGYITYTTFFAIENSATIYTMYIVYKCFFNLFIVYLRPITHPPTHPLCNHKYISILMQFDDERIYIVYVYRNICITSLL